MFRHVAILKTSKPVPPSVLRFAFFEALILLRSGEAKRSFRSPEIGEGQVETKRETQSMGGFAGVACDVIADHDGGTTRFTCLVDDPGREALDLENPLHYASIFAHTEAPADVLERFQAARAYAAATHAHGAD